MADPLVFDVRTEGDPSFSFLSGSGEYGKLAENEYSILQDFYGMEVDRVFGEQLAVAGELYWRLHAFELKSGPALFQPQVWQNGAKYVATPGDDANVAVAFHWPDAPTLDSGWTPQYTPNALIGWTEGKGDVGFGYSSSQAARSLSDISNRLNLIDLAPQYKPLHIGEFGAASIVGGGPFWIWVMSGGGKVGSDCATRLNWVDAHLTPNPIFQITQKGGDTPPTVSGDYLVNINAAGTITGHIPFLDGPPPSGAAALGIARDGAIVRYIPWRDL